MFEDYKSEVNVYGTKEHMDRRNDLVKIVTSGDVTIDDVKELRFYLLRDLALLQNEAKTIELLVIQLNTIVRSNENLQEKSLSTENVDADPHDVIQKGGKVKLAKATR